MNIFSRFFKRKPIWEYGTLDSGLAARHNRVTGETQFLLWPKGSRQGEHVYKEDFWHRAGFGHEFIPYPKDE